MNFYCSRSLWSIWLSLIPPSPEQPKAFARAIRNMQRTLSKGYKDGLGYHVHYGRSAACAAMRKRSEQQNLRQSTQIFAITDTIAERARKIGGTTIRSISDIAKNQRLKDNNKEGVSPQEMISELCDDNQQLTRALRAAHEVCDRHNDVATASLIEVWIDESERRTWFLSEIAHGS